MPDVPFGAVSLQLRSLVESRPAGIATGEGHSGSIGATRGPRPVGEILERMWNDALWRLKLAAGWSSRVAGPSRAAG